MRDAVRLADGSRIAAGEQINDVFGRQWTYNGIATYPQIVPNDGSPPPHASTVSGRVLAIGPDGQQRELYPFELCLEIRDVT